MWQYPRGRRRPQFITASLKTMPNLDSNASYLFIQHRNHKRTLVLNQGQRPYAAFKVFFWVGSRCLEYDRNFQESVALVSEMQDRLEEAKVRFYVEYEYSESF